MFKMEDSMSSTNYKLKDFDSVAEVECSSEDISWSLFTEDLITSSIIDDSAVCSGAQSSYSVKKMCPNDDRIAPARSISKRRKTRVPVVDHDLEDTASSPVCSSKVQNWEHSYMQLLETEYGLNTLPQEHLYQNDYRSFSQGRKTTSDKTDAVHLGFTGKDIIYTGLRKKGLCLLPVSMLFNFS